MNELIKVGRPLGSWWPNNQCQSFASSVIDSSRTKDWRKKEKQKLQDMLRRLNRINF